MYSQPNQCFRRAFASRSLPASYSCGAAQVLGAVQIVVGVIAFASVVVILAVLLARGEQAGYSVVTVFVILVSTVPVGEALYTSRQHHVYNKATN